MIFDFLFLPVLFFIGAVTSWQDLRCGKIKNKWVVLGLIYGLGLILVFFLWDLTAQSATKFFYLKIKGMPADSPVLVFTITFQYLEAVVINFLFSMAAGFAMWKFGAWSAGDAKLFFVFSLLLPLKYYSKSYLPLFPSFALLINIFIPIFFFLMVKAVFFGGGAIQRIKKLKMEDFKKKALSGLLNFLRMFLGFAAMFLIVQGTQKIAGGFLHINFSAIQVFVLFCLFFVGKPLFNFLKNNIVFAALALFWFFFISAGYFYFHEFLVGFLSRIFYMALIFVVCFGSLRKLLELYLKEKETKEINAEHLNSHSQICKDFWLDIKHSDSKIYNLLEKKSFLDSEDIEIVKNFCLQNGCKKIKVYKSFPFALWMTAGLVLTIILRGSVLSGIVKYLQF